MHTQHSIRRSYDITSEKPVTRLNEVDWLFKLFRLRAIFFILCSTNCHEKLVPIRSRALHFACLLI
jgi:hypothetical protein